MTLREWIANLKAKLLTASDAEKPAIEALLKDVESVESDKPNGHPVPTPTPVNASSADIAALIRQAVDDATGPLKQQVDTFAGLLSKEQKDRQDREEVIRNHRAEARAAQITQYVDTAVADGRIAADDVDTWRTRFEQGYDLAKEILGGMAKSPAINNGKSVKDNAPDDGAGEKKYDSRFARSIPPKAMEYVEKSIADS